MTFNIRFAKRGDRENAWEHRKHMVAATIRFHRVDVAGLQEALGGQVNDLLEDLPGYAAFGRGRDGAAGGERCTILYRKDRLDLIRDETFWLSETPDRPSRSWDAALRRISTWGEFHDRVTGTHFFLFNTHFDHQGAVARAESARLLLRRIRDTAGRAPVLLTGDFNCDRLSEAYGILTGGAVGPATAATGTPERLLFDTRYVSEAGHYGPSGTFTGFDGSGQPGLQIDFIFAGNAVRVLEHGIISDTWDGRVPSDHRPIVVDVLPGREPAGAPPPPDTQVLMEKQNFSIRSPDARALKYPIHVPADVRSPARLSIGIGNSSDNTGDGGLHWRLEDENGKIVRTEFLRKDGVAWIEHDVPPGSTWTLVLEDLDTALDGKQPGNGGTVEVLLWSAVR